MIDPKAMLELYRLELSSILACNLTRSGAADQAPTVPEDGVVFGTVTDAVTIGLHDLSYEIAHGINDYAIESDLVHEQLYWKLGVEERRERQIRYALLKQMLETVRGLELLFAKREFPQALFTDRDWVAILRGRKLVGFWDGDKRCALLQLLMPIIKDNSLELQG